MDRMSPTERSRAAEPQGFGERVEGLARAAAEQWRPIEVNSGTFGGLMDLVRNAERQGFIEGAKWQAAQQQPRPVPDLAAAIEDALILTVNRQDSARCEYGCGVEVIRSEARRVAERLAQSMSVPQPAPDAEALRERIIDALVMSPLSDTAGTSMAPVYRTADAILAALPPAQPAVSAAQAWDEGHRIGWEHCQDGNYGTDHWDDETVNPYQAPVREDGGV